LSPSRRAAAVTGVEPPPREPVVVMPRLDEGRSDPVRYPTLSRYLGEEGAVLLQALVDLDGRVAETTLVRSCGFPRLDWATRAGIAENYRFVPGTVDGIPMRMWITFKVIWGLSS
jgi:periplasmic protein TonB